MKFAQNKNLCKVKIWATGFGMWKTLKPPAIRYWMYQWYQQAQFSLPSSLCYLHQWYLTLTEVAIPLQRELCHMYYSFSKWVTAVTMHVDTCVSEMCEPHQHWQTLLGHCRINETHWNFSFCKKTIPLLLYGQKYSSAECRRHWTKTRPGKYCSIWIARQEWNRKFHQFLLIIKA
jgi:hypothetical protein